MRKLAIIGTLLTLAGCAAGGHPHFRGPPPPGHRGGPEGPGGHRDGRLFLSPMGEPFRAEGGISGAALWFRETDANSDGVLTQDEFEKDAARFFKVLDRNGDGEIDPDEVAYYEKVLVPESGGGERPVGGPGEAGGHPGGGRHGPGGGGGMRGPGEGGGGRHGHGGGGMGRDGGGGGEGRSGGGSAEAMPDYADMGAARYSYLPLPEPITAADTNFDASVSLDEFLRAADRRFALLDKNHDGKITRAELPRIGGGEGRHRRRRH
ncbi:hypothetical protein GCM10023219_00670 [Stakelama sediminis]|uniref:EF-hand domain-containing protein n=1 Tax=Stakelama sediminis TaxID=463200 RepID=A0A840Z139_9SPHN|nr:EF-hand domain-containing protein [Stakelama sediminis]MBB5719497.1 hypothetical protein [Stakelama sediminis]